MHQDTPRGYLQGISNFRQRIIRDAEKKQVCLAITKIQVIGWRRIEKPLRDLAGMGKLPTVNGHDGVPGIVECGRKVPGQVTRSDKSNFHGLVGFVRQSVQNSTFVRTNPDSVPLIDVIIPAFNEENAVGKVVQELPRTWIREIVVVNNNSNDQTARAATEAGATVLQEARQGYGFACLKGIEYLRQKPIPPDIVVFIDADYSDFPTELPSLVRPITERGLDLVIGSRALGARERGSMTPQQVFGNWLATTLLRWLYGVRFTDLGPFRAIRFDKLLELDMRDQTYGWTVEMQLKAAKLKMRTGEVPVGYRRRIGFSKISGTVKGTIGAGCKIITTIFRYL